MGGKQEPQNTAHAVRNIVEEPVDMYDLYMLGEKAGQGSLHL